MLCCSQQNTSRRLFASVLITDWGLWELKLHSLFRNLHGIRIDRDQFLAWSSISWAGLQFSVRHQNDCSKLVTLHGSCLFGTGMKIDWHISLVKRPLSYTSIIKCLRYLSAVLFSNSNISTLKLSGPGAFLIFAVLIAWRTSDLRIFGPERILSKSSGSSLRFGSSYRFLKYSPISGIYHSRPSATYLHCPLFRCALRSSCISLLAVECFGVLPSAWCCKEFLLPWTSCSGSSPVLWSILLSLCYVLVYSHLYDLVILLSFSFPRVQQFLRLSKSFDSASCFLVRIQWLDLSLGRRSRRSLPSTFSIGARFPVSLLVCHESPRLSLGWCCPSPAISSLFLCNVSSILFSIWRPLGCGHSSNRPLLPCSNLGHWAWIFSAQVCNRSHLSIFCLHWPKSIASFRV